MRSSFRKITNLQALCYYFASMPKILEMNFWAMPLVFFRKPILIRIQGLQFYVSTLMDIWTLKEVIFDKCYFKESKVKKGAVVVDIGASIGDFAILSGKRAKIVYALEKDPERIKLMRMNLQKNHSHNIQIMEGQVRSLDEIFRRLKIQKCDFLKIDCEGGEYTILQKSQFLSKVKNMALEIHLFNKKMYREYEQLKAKLINLGFQIKEEDNPVHGSLKFLYASLKN